MHAVRFVGSALLSGLILAAQGQPPAPTPLPPTTPAPLPQKQDPDKPAPTPADRAAELAKEKERLQQEIAFVRSRAANLSGDLKQKLAQRGLQVRSIDAGQNAVIPAAPVLKKARKFNDAELQSTGADVLLTVGGSAVREGDLVELLDYLQTFQASGDATMRQQRVMFELIRTRATTAALGDQVPVVEQAIRQAHEQVTAQNKPFDEVAKAVSKGPNAETGGKIEVLRNSGYGLKLEQVAFTTKEGEISQPFHTPNGACIVRAGKRTKGETSDTDKVDVELIQIPWHPDQNELSRVHTMVATGQMEILVRDDRAMAMVPPLYRPSDVDPVAERQAQVQRAKDQIRMLDDEIAQRQSASSDVEKSRLEELKKLRQTLVDQLQKLEAKAPDEKVEDPEKVDGAEKKSDEAKAPPVEK